MSAALGIPQNGRPRGRAAAARDDARINDTRSTAGGTAMTHRSRLAAALTLAAAPLAALAQAGDPDLGRNLAATCASCHGTNGRVLGDTVKPLAGVSADKIVAAMNDFRSGAQPATIMHQIAKGYTDDQVKAVAAFFAAQKPR
jgi:cytochrome subunit of sulfide dehydrogenase